MLSPLDQLKTLIASELKSLDKEALPMVAERLETPAGKQSIEDWIFRLCSKEGMSVGSALAIIESELV